jgi:hypothetical protein
MLTLRTPLVLSALLIAAAPLTTIVLASTVDVMGDQCSNDSAGATPNAAAVGAIPANLLTIYQQVGDEYDLPWQVLAGIGQEECDQGRDTDPACALQTGAQGPGIANAAGASGLMQIGVGGQAGDAYDQLRHHLTDPSLGPHDPATAVELAALVLIRDDRAAPGQPIDSYGSAVAAYNGTGPAAQQYASRVLADANSYGSATLPAGPGACQAADVALVAGDRARISSNGMADAPVDAPTPVQDMIAAGNGISHFPYSYGGGHGAAPETMSQTKPDPAADPGEQENGGPGYDCSSATDYVLYGGGYGRTLLQGEVPASTTLESVGDPGPGKWVTIYANASHAYIEVAGIYLDTAAGEGRPPNPPATGPRWTQVGSGPAGFIPRHPPGL